MKVMTNSTMNSVVLTFTRPNRPLKIRASRTAENSAADELPWPETTPLGLGVIDDVAQQRVDEDLAKDTPRGRGDPPITLPAPPPPPEKTQAGKTIKIVHRVVEGGRRGGGGGLLADATVRGCRFVAHFFLLLKIPELKITH